MATIPEPSPLAVLSTAFCFRSRLQRFLLGACCALSVVWFAAGASGASQRYEKHYALIYGTVWGPDNHPLYGVRVKVRRADEKKIRWELISDHEGEFALRVAPGPSDYVVTADLKGYKYNGGRTLRLEEDVKVHIDNEERQDIGLHLTN